MDQITMCRHRVPEARCPTCIKENEADEVAQKFARKNRAAE